jgi:hypothetical protein
MIVQSRQGFVEPTVDYRHEELMASVAQCIAVRRSRSRWLQDLLRRPANDELRNEDRLQSALCHI